MKGLICCAVLAIGVMAVEAKGQEKAAITVLGDGIAISPDAMVSGVDGEPCIIKSHLMSNCRVVGGGKALSLAAQMAVPDAEERAQELEEEDQDLCPFLNYRGHPFDCARDWRLQFREMLIREMSGVQP